MATVEVQNRLLNTDGKGFSNYIYNQLKEPNVPLFKTPEMALVLDQIFTIKNGKLSVDLSKIIWSSTDNTEYVKARDQVIWYLKVFKLPEGIDTRSAAELALMTHYRLYVAQPELQLANNGALGKKILKLSEFYEDMKVNYQEKMPAAQRQLAVQKMNVMIPLKGYERKEIEPIQPCEHHKEIMELFQKIGGFVLNGDINLDKLVALFQVNGDKIAVNLQYGTQGKERTEDIKVGNVLWEQAEKKQDNVAEITEPKVAEIAIKLLLGHYKTLYTSYLTPFRANCMFKNVCELAVLSSLMAKNGLPNAASKIHELNQVLKKNNKHNIVTIKKPLQLSITEIERQNLLSASARLADVGISAIEENQRRRRIDMLHSDVNGSGNDSVAYSPVSYNRLTADGKRLERVKAQKNNMRFNGYYFVSNDL